MPTVRRTRTAARRIPRHNSRWLTVLARLQARRSRTSVVWRPPGLTLLRRLLSIAPALLNVLVAAAVRFDVQGPPVPARRTRSSRPSPPGSIDVQRRLTTVSTLARQTFDHRRWTETVRRTTVRGIAMTLTAAGPRPNQPVTVARGVRETPTPATVRWRLMHRADRHEGGGHTPVRVIVARPAVSGAPQSSVASMARSATAFAGSRAPMPIAETVAPPADFVIDRLTEEILRQLDRRLIATRERMGTR